MLPRFAVLFGLARLALVILLAPALVAASAFHVQSFAAAATDEDDDDFDDEDDDDEDDDDEDDDDEDDDEEEGEGYSQPPVTAGGLFTNKTYPFTEIERPLTVSKGIIEVRGGIDIDVGAQTAFEIWRAKLDARYGIQDHVELQGGFELLLAGDTLPGELEAKLGLGIEGALSYDVIHFRVLAEIPFITATSMDGQESTTDVGFDIVLGVPFRYRVLPELAIIALDKLITIHFAGGKPDLTVGVGGVYQALPKLAGIVRAELFVPEANPDFLTIPITAAAQFSPNNKFDIGAEFTLGDVLDEEDPLAQRSLLLFVQARF